MEKLKLYQYFSQIPVPNELENDLIDTNGKQIEFIENLSQVNILLGTNNSGKSRIIREIIRNPIKPIYFSPDEQKKLTELIQNAQQLFFDYIISLGRILASRNYTIRNYYDNQFLDFNIQSNDIRIDKTFIENKLNKKDDILKLILNIEELIKSFNQSFHTFNLPQFGIGLEQQNKEEFQRVSKRIFTELKNSLQYLIFKNIYQRIYVPSQRSLKTLYKRAGAKNEIIRAYKFNTVNENEKDGEYAYKGVVIDNGESFYDEILENLTTGHNNRRNVEDFEKFLAVNFFENRSVELIPHTKDKELHIKIGEEKQQPIYNLGDGLQMLIIMTWPLFNYDYGIMAIEEPELYIHPGLQKKLIEIFSSHPKAQNFIFFISSHSNHIVDASHDAENISLFTVRKQLDDSDSKEKLPKFIIENVGFNNRDALSLIGVSNSSVYLANCTVWVEGITDKLYLTKFIDAYLSNLNFKRKPQYKDFKKYKEGTHYSFVLSGGSSIVHWDFDEASTYETEQEKIIVKNLCGRAFVIVDDDNKKNIKRKKKFEEILGLRFYQLPVVEIENLLSFDTIKKTIKSYPKCAELDETRMKAPTTKMMKDKSIGALIDNYILKDFKEEKIKKFKSKGSKTVTNKVDFCSKALNHITPQNLSPNAIRIVERILDFVEEHN